MDQQRYLCRNLPQKGFPSADHAVWSNVPLVSLVDVVTGKVPVLETSFQMFRDDDQQCFYLRFAGADEGIRSDFRLHDEPLWKQDVVELFLADGESLEQYKELQVSPWDLHFDGIIRFIPDGTRQLDLGWDVEGFVSQSRFDRRKQAFTSVWCLPYASFERKPARGTSWRFNAFRVDTREDQQDLLAWQKTGVPNFHVPECFGYLDFDA